MNNFVFFGSSRFSVIVLDELERVGFKPALVVTTPDKPQGRKLTLTPNVVKVWAQQRNIRVLDPETLGADFIKSLVFDDSPDIAHWNIFVVASYGKIIPAVILNIPTHFALNIHPSLLPKYRGASPLPSAMLDDTKNTGVTIMKMDEKMDHGPIVAQENVTVTEWPTYDEFEELMARTGARLLARTMPDWIAGKIPEKEQDHAAATYTKKITKEDGLLDLSADPYLNFRKIQAYHTWPQAFFMHEHDGKSIRVKVTSANFTDGKLTIEKVIPEGSKEMSFGDFQRGYRV